MDNLEDSENTAKVADSAYSHSCSNSQSRRSHSSKSTNSGSHSSGSSGYGGKPSTSGSSNNLGLPPKKDKEPKKKKLPKVETAPKVEVETEIRPPEPEAPVFVVPKEEPRHDAQTVSPVHAIPEIAVDKMDVSTPDQNSLKNEVVVCTMPLTSSSSNVGTGRLTPTYNSDGFSCVISMHDGVVMYTTSSLTMTLGFPKDMWIGKSFIDFVHPSDRSTFASQITSSVAVPKIVNAQSPANSVSSMVCRIRRYRGLSSGYGVKNRVVTFMPFLLKLTFKNVSDDEGKFIYLVIQAKPFYSAFKTPNEIIKKVVPFVIRHAANGIIEYVDPESVPYLGYLPQDLMEKDAVRMYHPEDLCYLRQIYETIVKEGGLPRCKPYRMVTQNGNYIKLETEWSSFINPWSKKLEFVIGKHHLVEGPANPDVFQAPVKSKGKKVSEEDRNKTRMLRESIIRIMKEVLTKPAEVAKQQMSKRCQDLASFMESLMEDQPKIDDELRLEIQDPDYYERDSVMLGGISPHHEYNDSKSSTETPLSYNQLNYNDTLQRYFNSHQPYSYEDYNTATGENILGIKDPRATVNHCLSPMAQNSRDSGEPSSSCESNGCVLSGNSTQGLRRDYQTRLTETLITKHNVEMEKELMKTHREIRSSSKGEREKVSNETRKKKKEHLARCNASFQPTLVCAPPTEAEQPHGVKRGSQQIDGEGTHKQHCSSAKQSRRRQKTLTTSAAAALPSSTITTTVAATQWPVTNGASNMNTYILGVGLPQQMSAMNPMTGMPGMLPVYYAPTVTQPMATSTVIAPSTTNQGIPTTPMPPMFQPPPMQYMMYGQPVYSSPIIYTPMGTQMPYHMQQLFMAQAMQYTNSANPLGLTNRNDEESIEPVPETTLSTNPSKTNRLGNSEEIIDRTDGESSYSSFYSSFFKTESGSAEDSGDLKKGQCSKDNASGSPTAPLKECAKPQQVKKVSTSKMDPPWIEQVCVTSELVYKYQVLTKTMEEVLLADKEKMSTFQQPSLVNEQLGQLYLDLQLEGVAARLTLEEGITSSSSSSDDTNSMALCRKRGYSKLVMIYEENAPMPPPEQQEGSSMSSL